MDWSLSAAENVAIYKIGKVLFKSVRALNINLYKIPSSRGLFGF